MAELDAEPRESKSDVVTYIYSITYSGGAAWYGRLGTCFNVVNAAAESFALRQAR